MFFFNYFSKTRTILTKPSLLRIQYRVEDDTDDDINPVIPLPDLKLYEAELLTSVGQTQFTCDYIGSIVLNLLDKLVIEECVEVPSIDQSSVTLQAFTFALTTYCSIGQNGAFRPINRELFQRRLVTIMFGALRNVLIVVGTDRRDVLDEYLDPFGSCKDILRMLTVECDRDLTGWSEEVLRIRREHVSAIVYLMLYMLHKTLQTDQQYQQLLDILKSQAVILSQTFCQFLLHHADLFSKCLSILFKLIRDVRSISSHDDASGQTHSSKTSRRSANRRLKKRSGVQAICTHHHQNTHELGCALERMLLSVTENLDAAVHLSVVFRFFQRNVICCCNNDLDNIKRLLIISRRLRVQKPCLNFIKNNILKSIYSNVECSVCDERKASFGINDAFVRLYRDWMRQLHPGEMIVFLKHIAKISKYIPFDISCKIFVDVVLPPFRREKLRLEEETDCFKSSDTMRSMSKDIIINCLNVFLCYLRDIRLIKGFFNDENIQHMEDLIVVPELASLVCCLLKIGLENSSFLGENCGEQLVLCEKLRQIKCNSVLHVTDVLVKLFDVLGGTSVPILKHYDVLDFNETVQSPNRILLLLQSNRLDVQGLLHLAVVYWNMILQLLRANAATASVEQQPERLFSSHTKDALIMIVFNSLKCFLHSPKTEPTSSDESTQFQLLDYSWISLNELCPSIEVWSVSAADTLPLKCDLHSEAEYIPSSFLQTEIDLNDILTDRKDDCIKQRMCSFNRSHTKETSITSISTTASSGFSFVFDVRNASRECYYVSSLPCGPTDVNTDCAQLGKVVETAVSADTSVANSGGLETGGTPAVVQGLIKYVSSKVLDTIFASAEKIESDSADIVESVNFVKKTDKFFRSDQLDAVHSAEYKKLFMQLFEITCGVIMCSTSSTSSGACKFAFLLASSYVMIIFKSSTVFYERNISIAEPFASDNHFQMFIIVNLQLFRSNIYACRYCN